MDNDLSKNKLFEDIRVLIEESRIRVATTVNTEMSFLYWKIGQRINVELYQQSNLESYGKKIVATLWRQLVVEYLTILPSQKVLQSKLHLAIEIARNKLAQEKEPKSRDESFLSQNKEVSGHE